MNPMTSKQLILSAAVLSLIITAGAISYTKAAENAEPPNDQGITQQETGRRLRRVKQFKNRRDMVGIFKDVRETIENGDYNAWAELMSQRPNANELVNPDTFTELQEMHELLQAGNREAAKKIADDLGLHKFGKPRIVKQKLQEFKEAIKSKDYDTWAALMEERPDYDGEINQQIFDKHLELHDLMQRVKKLREELGLKRPIRGPGATPLLEKE